jgi:CRP-like cAMP-binding protein
MSPWRQHGTVAAMLASQTALLSAYPVHTVAAGSVLLRRAVRPTHAIFLESGRVLLGVAHADIQGEETHVQPLEHQLGAVEGPAWLEVNAAVLSVPSAVDGVAETEVTLRRVPIAEFQAQLVSTTHFALAVFTDMARAYRRQTELAVSRFAKDAEARCAEWLLSHAESNDKGGSAVRLQQRKRLIAAQLGIAPETLSRVLRHLRERSLISGSGRVLNLVDPGGLRSLAGI